MITRKSSVPTASTNNHHEQKNGFHDNHMPTKEVSNRYYENYLLLGPSKNSGKFVNMLIFVLFSTL